MAFAGITLHPGDCLEVLATLPADHFDSCVCDPPYGLEFMSVAWDTYRPNGNPRSDADFKDYGSKEHPRNATESARIRRNKNLSFGEFSIAWAREVYRVLKPGAHLVAFGGTRTYHRLACAIEDAGFEIRDQIAWVYGQGFPKSLNVSKAIDRAAGAERTELIGSKLGRPGMARDGSNQRNGFDAAFREGMRCVMIEREEEYCADIRRRMALAGSGKDERRRQAHKEKQSRKPIDNAGTLFASEWDEMWKRPFYSREVV